MYLSLEQVYVELTDEKARKKYRHENSECENHLLASENKEICQKYRAVELSF